MSKTVARASLSIVFVALLAFLGVDRYLSATETKAAEGLPKEAALARYGFFLEEVSREIGIDFHYQAPVIDSKLDHIMPREASMWAAVSFVDLDRGGWRDIYVTTRNTDE